jgi:hypothetical protein
MLFRETVAVYCENHTEHTNTLCGQNTQSVPHRKHITSPLQSQTGSCCFGKQSLFIVRTTRNTQIHSVDRMQGSINVKDDTAPWLGGHPFQHEVHLHSIQNASFYLIQNTLRVHYKDRKLICDL